MVSLVGGEREWESERGWERDYVQECRQWPRCVKRQGLLFVFFGSLVDFFNLWPNVMGKFWATELQEKLWTTSLSSYNTCPGVVLQADHHLSGVFVPVAHGPHAPTWGNTGGTGRRPLRHWSPIVAPGRSALSPRLSDTAMALEADGHRGSSRSAHEKYPRAALERSGYVRTCVTPLQQDAGSQSRLRLAVTWTCRRRLSSAACVASVSVILALLLTLVDWDAGSSSRGTSSGSGPHSAAGCAVELLLTVCYCVSPVFTLVCAFFWVGLYLIRCGVLVRTALFLLAVCHLGEAAAQSLLRGAEEQLLSLPATLVVLGCLGSGALLVVRLGQGVSILVFVSVIRAVSLVSLSRVRASWRPYLAYLLGLLGVLLARYADRLLPAPGTSGTGCCGSVTGAKEEDIPVFKRRRRSSSIAASEMMAHGHNNSKSHRRTSLPCIPRDQVRHVQVCTSGHGAGSVTAVLVTSLHTAGLWAPLCLMACVAALRASAPDIGPCYNGACSPHALLWWW